MRDCVELNRVRLRCKASAKSSVGGRVPPSQPFLERMVGNSSLISDLVDDVESVSFSIFKEESDSMFDQLFFRSDPLTRQPVF